MGVAPQPFRFLVQATVNVGTPNGINAGFHFRNDAKRHCERDKGGRVSIVCADTGDVLLSYQRGEEVPVTATA